MENLIFEISQEDREGVSLPSCDVPLRKLENEIESKNLRKIPPQIPCLSEPLVIRHFVNLSVLNHHVDKGFYPLGSCTMKYNPKINEDLAHLPGFLSIHPLQDERTVQGALRLMAELADCLCEISGMDEVTLQPAAGAQGELTAIKIIRAFHQSKGNIRSKVLIPDSAHGTNPASTSLSGYQAVTVKSNKSGLVDIEELEKKMNEEVACLLLTTPNTLGLFESQIREIERIVHGKGGLLYMDGANLNAILGITRPVDMGFDLVHFNLHKTFSTPHGGGGPGAGPVGVKEFLSQFLPVPVIKKDKEVIKMDYNRPQSIGKVHGFYGNFGMMVRAYVYIRMLGNKGLKEVSENAILNANYIMKSLESKYYLPYPGPCKHECVFSGIWQRDKFGIKTLDIAKRLLDFGFYAPTIYFPLIVSEAIMIEPTETESKEEMDKFIEAMLAIAKEAEENPEVVKSAPHNTPVGRIDEVKAARDLKVNYFSG